MSDHEEFNVQPDEITHVDDLGTASSMPIGVDGFGTDDGNLTYGAGGSAANSKGWMVIVAVIILAASGLFAMHSLAKITASTGGDAAVDGRIETFLNQIGGKGYNSTVTELVSGHDTIITILADDYSELQVPLDHVQFNPFAINRDAAPSQPTFVDASDGDIPLRKKRAKRRAEIEDVCARLRLKSVMMGNIPLANISGRIVRLGEPLSVDDIDFNITKITKYRVTLTAEDAKLNLVVDVVLELELIK